MDGDEAGKKATAKITRRLKESRLKFAAITLDDGREPESLDYEALNKYSSLYRGCR